MGLLYKKLDGESIYTSDLCYAIIIDLPDDCIKIYATLSLVMEEIVPIESRSMLSARNFVSHTRDVVENISNNL